MADFTNPETNLNYKHYPSTEEYRVLRELYGEKGNKGNKGPKGIRGRKGERGSLNLPSSTDGQKGELGIKGVKGEKGEKGEKGQKGIWQKGEKGIQGPTSLDKGEKGFKGPAGELGVKGIENKGERGKKGEQIKGGYGKKGEKGEKGDIGQQGASHKGPKGFPGEPGNDGPRGQDGERGQKGPKGPRGNNGGTGPSGAKGNRGNQGNNGANGSSGKDYYNYKEGGELRTNISTVSGNVHTSQFCTGQACYNYNCPVPYAIRKGKTDGAGRLGNMQGGYKKMGDAPEVETIREYLHQLKTRSKRQTMFRDGEDRDPRIPGSGELVPQHRTFGFDCDPETFPQILRNSFEGWETSYEEDAILAVSLIVTRHSLSKIDALKERLL